MLATPKGRRSRTLITETAARLLQFGADVRGADRRVVGVLARPDD